MDIINKYIPKNFNDFIGNKDIIESLENITKYKNIPHLLISGNYGSGKTLIKNILIKNINIDKKNILYLNLNTNLKKNIIKDSKLYIFLRKPVKNYIIIDNYESLELEQQYILRSFINNYNKHSTFFIFLNNTSNLIEQLTNYFLIFKLKKNKKEDYYNYLKNIIDKENINIKDDLLNYLINISNNFRELNNNFLIILLYNKIENNLNSKQIQNILNIPNKKYTYKIINNCNQKNIHDNVEIINFLLNSGYSVNDIINNIIIFIKDYNDINYEKKIKYIKIILSYQVKTNNNLNTYTQLLSLISELSSL